MTATNQILNNCYAVVNFNTVTLGASGAAWAGNYVASAYAIGGMEVLDPSTGRGWEVTVPFTGAYEMRYASRVDFGGTAGWTYAIAQIVLNGSAAAGYAITSGYSTAANYGTLSTITASNLTAGNTINVEYLTGPTATFTYQGVTSSLPSALMVQYMGTTLPRVV